MISDVLSDAVDQIRAYQSDLKASYDNCSPAINTVCEVMDSLRTLFDTPPAPFLHEALQQLNMAIGHIDLVAIRSARQTLADDWRKSGPFTSDEPNGEMSAL